MAKTAVPQRDGITVVIPVHNAAPQLEKALPAWGQLLGSLNRPFQIFVVNDGSTDDTALVLQKLAGKVQHLRALTHDTRRGFGACLRTGLAEATQPLFFYTGADAQYTPSDIRPMLERVELRDEIFGKQPDLISGARAGRPRPAAVVWLSGAWKLFWRVFAGLPMNDAPPWYGWGAWWYRTRAGWTFGVPLADVNSAFKLYRTAFLKRFPIQSDGDFVHVELVAKATFLTSIMDEVPLTPKSEPHPLLGPVTADRSKVFHHPEFAFKPESQPKPPEPPAVSAAPASVIPEPNPAPVSAELPVSSTPQEAPKSGATDSPGAPVPTP